MERKNEQSIQNKEVLASNKDSEKEDIRRGQEGMDAEGNTHSQEEVVNLWRGPRAGKDETGSGRAKH